MLGGDVRNLNAFCKALVLNDNLIRINQDTECRPPYVAYRGRVINSEWDEEDQSWWREYPDCGFTLFKHLSGDQFAIGYFNFAPRQGEVPFTFADVGLPYGSDVKLEVTDAITGENLGLHRDYLNLQIPAHDCRIFLARMVE